MLEYFAIASLVEHMENKKKKEDVKLQEYFSDDQKDIQVVVTKSSNYQVVNLVMGIISIIIAILTARLAYDCNKKSDIVVRLLATIFGFFFSTMYLFYYFIRYILLGGKC
jgi:hypothetical protein